MKMTKVSVARPAVLVIAAASVAIAAGCGKQDAENANPRGSMQSMQDRDPASNQESMKDMPMPETGSSQTSTSGVSAQAHMTRGTIESVDRAAGTVKIAHEAVPALNWPAMTMDFHVDDKQALAGLKEGDRIEFHFSEKSAGQYAITQISQPR